jgi:peptidoglycan/xylan/chitin deacetylase (PgdA/CDA1 family)
MDSQKISLDNQGNHREGHELASHGYGHQCVGDLYEIESKADIIKAKATLEDVSG